MITITLLIQFDRKKYNEEVLNSLEKFKKGDTNEIESLIAKIDKQIVVDFWDFSDIPEDDEELNNFFEDFILALEEELIEKKQLPANIDRVSLRNLIINMIHGSKYDDNLLPNEIIQRISLSGDLAVSNSEINNFNEDEYIDDHDCEDDECDCGNDVDILSCEMEDILEQVKEDKKADADAVMYFKARLIEGFCIPVKRDKYRYDLSANLLNVFLFSLSTQIKDIMKCKNKGAKLSPILHDSEKDFAEDIFDRYLDTEAIIELMADIDTLILSYNIESEFDKIDKMLRDNIKGEWWKRMSDSDKISRIKSWWNCLDELRLFLQDSLDNGYDILISTI